MIPAFQPNGAMLIAVERGMVVAEVERGLSGEERLPITLVRGDRATLQNAAATVRNVGEESAVVLVLTLAPAGAAAGVEWPAVVTSPL